MKVLAVFSLALALLGCRREQDDDRGLSKKADIDTQTELVAIEQLRSDFELAIKKGEYDKIEQFVTRDVKTVGAGGDGWDQMRQLGRDRGRFPYDSIIMQPTETVIINDSMAYDWGTSSVYYTDEKGSPVELQDSFLVLLKKEKGKWKIYREVASSLVTE